MRQDVNDQYEQKGAGREVGCRGDGGSDLGGPAATPGRWGAGRGVEAGAAGAEVAVPGVAVLAASSM